MRGDGPPAPRGPWAARLEPASCARPSLAAERVVEAARGWLRTPYQHRSSLRGIGCDCLGLVRGVWREVVGAEPASLPPYTVDWAEAGAGEPLVEAMDRWFEPVSAWRAGDVLAFRMAEGARVKHLGIVSAPDRIIHAYWGRAVVESWLQPWWMRRAAGAWRFPE